jgi:transposase-like protein
VVLETFKETGERHGVIGRIARQLGIGDQSLRTWVAQAEVNTITRRIGQDTARRAMASSSSVMRCLVRSESSQWPTRPLRFPPAPRHMSPSET